MTHSRSWWHGGGGTHSGYGGADLVRELGMWRGTDHPLFNFQHCLRTGICRSVLRWRAAIKRAHVAIEHRIVGELAPIDRFELCSARLTPTLLLWIHRHPKENQYFGGA